AGCQSSYLFSFCIGFGLFECIEAEEETAQVGDILSLCGFAVDMKCVDRGELGELADDKGGFVPELLAVGGLPPVVKVAFFIELATFVVKAMGDLMTDRGS